MKANFKNFLVSCLLALLMALPGIVFADVDSIVIKLGGGCRPSNTRGNCTVRATAAGSELGDEALTLQRASSPRARFRDVKTRDLNNSGRVSFVFRNKTGCYRAETARNGDQQQDVRSNVVCEGSAASDSSSSGSSISQGSSSAGSSSSAVGSVSSSVGSSSQGSSSSEDDDDSSSSRSSKGNRGPGGGN